MSLNICMSCSFQKKKCQCVPETTKIKTKVKISWWKKLIFWR